MSAIEWAAQRSDGVRVRTYALAAVAGAIMSYSIAPSPPYIAVPALFFGLGAAFYLLLRTDAPRRAAWIGWVFGFTYFCAGLWWIGSAFDINAPKFGWMKPFAVTLLPAFLALYWAAAFRLALWAEKRWGLRRNLRLASVVALWSILELVRGYALTGFPWGLVGYAWLDTAGAQTAAWIGPYGLSAVTFAAAAPLGFAAHAFLDGRRKEALRGALAFVVAVSGLLLAGWTRLPAGAHAASTGPLIRLVQPNIPQHEKGDWNLAPAHKAVLLSLTSQPSDRPIDLVVWPEASSPYVALQADAHTREEYAASAPNGAIMVIGSLRFVRSSAKIEAALNGQGVLNLPGLIYIRSVGSRGSKLKWWNSVFVLSPRGEVAALYDKQHLVPFGEMVPFEDWMRAIGVTPVASAFQTGREQGVIELGDGRRILALICYEAVFPRLAMTSESRRPDMILHLTNDAWFGDSAGPWQHLAQARYRAIEQGLPVYRAANTGVTAAIDGYGRIIELVDVGRRGVIDISASATFPRTLYAGVGEALWLGLLLVGCVIFAFASRSEHLSTGN